MTIDRINYLLAKFTEADRAALLRHAESIAERQGEDGASIREPAGERHSERGVTRRQ